MSYLNVTYNEYVGGLGTCTFNQCGGTNTIGGAASGQADLIGYLYLGNSDITGLLSNSVSGTYNLSGSGVLVARNEIFGVYNLDGEDVGPTGIFNQSGGTNIVSGTLVLGKGVYNLTGGAIEVLVKRHIVSRLHFQLRRRNPHRGCSALYEPAHDADRHQRKRER